MTTQEIVVTNSTVSANHISPSNYSLSGGAMVVPVLERVMIRLPGFPVVGGSCAIVSREMTVRCCRFCQREPVGTSTRYERGVSAED